MKIKIKRILAMCLSLVLITSVMLGEDVSIESLAAQNETSSYSEAGTMTIASRRVTKADLYGNVPEVQKSVNDANPVAVVNEVLNVDISGNDIIDYIRFAGASASPAQRKTDVGTEAISFSSVQTALAGVADWTNLPISIEGGDSTVTATNFQGEGTVVTFSVDTVADEERSLTIYAGGHPNTGTITASATMGNEVLAVIAGDEIDTSYAFTPNSSQVTEYRLDYTGTGEELVVTLSLSGTNNVSWAGIAVAAAVLRSLEDSEPEVQSNEVIVKEKVVSKSSIYGNVPEIQKTVNDNNAIAVEDKIINLDFTTADVIDYLRFTGTQTPVAMSEAANRILEFRSSQMGISEIADWSNLSITYGDETATTTATNFLGENASVTFSVETVEGEERILDIYAGGHPNTGTYTVTANLGDQVIPIKAGENTAESYIYTPASSQIVHYCVKYTGTGQELEVKISLTGTGNVGWAGIGVAAAVLREEISVLSPQSGSFNKSVSDAEYGELSTVITGAEGVSFDKILLNEDVVSTENYVYEDSTGLLTFKIAYLATLQAGNYEFKVCLSNGEVLNYSVNVSDASNSPRPYVKEKGSLSNSDLDAWNLWYQDEFNESLDDWWEPSYLKWWNYSSESNEEYNTIEYSEAAGSNVLKQFTTEDMRADSIVTRRDNFRNPGITLGVRDLIHNYAAKDLTNYQHMPADDRGATAYGYFEIRAKITGGTTSKTQSGSSAWWFTGFQDASWQTVEMDMVEYGYGVTEANLNAHFASPMHKWRDPFVSGNNSTWNSTDKTLDVSKPADDYHIYGFEWTPDGMNGYFDGVLVWSKNVNVNYRMLMWISLNSHAYETYTTDAKSHYIDYVRVWKTEELEELEKQLVTKNIVQKQAPTESNIATLAYAGANGLRSSHYQTYDPGYMNDGDTRTSYKATTAAERALNSYPVTPYNNDEHYLYLDWVEYTNEEIATASNVRENVTDLNGESYTLASEQEIRSSKDIAAIEVVVNKNVITKTINSSRSNNSTGTFAYDEESETVNLFPYKYDIEYSEDGYNGWTSIASNVTAQWNFNEEGMASYVTNISPIQDVNHIRLHVKSVWNSETNQEENLENGFYVAEIKVYETAKNGASTSIDDYNYNHAAYADVYVTDNDGNAGSEDTNFPVCDVADGVYVNEFRSSGDGVRLANNPNRVDTSIENVPNYPQYINFKWEDVRTIDNFDLTIGYAVSAPTSFELQTRQADGSWKTVVTANETWSSDFESKNYIFDEESTSWMRVVILDANKGTKIEYNGGIEGNASRVVRIAGGYYSIAEIELNESR